MNKKGFTLIELLVVIAIIGILSSIVLASLGTARKKGQIAAAKGELTDLRSQAELNYSTYGNYTAMCGGGFSIGPSPLPTAYGTITSSSNSSAFNTLQSMSKRGFTIRVGCGSNDQNWAGAILDGTNAFCIDSSGSVGAFSSTAAGVCNTSATAL